MGRPGGRLIAPLQVANNVFVLNAANVRLANGQRAAKPHLGTSTRRLAPDESSGACSPADPGVRSLVILSGWGARTTTSQGPRLLPALGDGD
jgi:hypothetical protein